MERDRDHFRSARHDPRLTAAGADDRRHDVALLDRKLPLSRRRLIMLGAGAAAGALGGLPPRRAAAVLKLDVTQGNVQPMPIALPDFVGGRAGRSAAPRAASPRSSPPICSAPACSRRSIRPPISRRSPTSTPCRAFPTGGRSTPRRWSPAASPQADGRLNAEFRLWDVFAGQQLAGQQYSTTPDNWRRIAHIISDAIYERITGDKGYFDTRVVFVDESGPK